MLSGWKATDLFLKDIQVLVSELSMVEATPELLALVGEDTTGRNAGVEWHTACGQKSGTGYVCRSRRLGGRGRYFSKRSDSHTG